MATNNYSPEHDSQIDQAPTVRRIPPEYAGIRVDRALARMFPEHSRSRVTAWLKVGRILLEGRQVSPDFTVWGGESVEIGLQNDPDPRAAPPAAEAIGLRVVHEDDAVLVIDKPAGLVVHPGSGNWSGTLLNALLHHAPSLEGVARAGIVHRLDKDTSGLLVVAKTLEAQTALVRQLQARTVERIYLALVHGRVERNGEVEAPIGRDPHNRVRMAITAGGKPALTRYMVQKRYLATTLLECKLATGRTHQIRVHLQSIGHPLVGDPVYKRAARAGQAGATLDFSRQALHALRLAFLHPASGERVEFHSPIHDDMQRLLENLE